MHVRSVDCASVTLTTSVGQWLGAVTKANGITTETRRPMPLARQ
jgi:hypothetical protein